MKIVTTMTIELIKILLVISIPLGLTAAISIYIAEKINNYFENKNTFEYWKGKKS